MIRRGRSAQVASAGTAKRRSWSEFRSVDRWSDIPAAAVLVLPSATAETGVVAPNLRLRGAAEPERPPPTSASTLTGKPRIHCAAAESTPGCRMKTGARITRTARPLGRARLPGIVRRAGTSGSRTRAPLPGSASCRWRDHPGASGTPARPPACPERTPVHGAASRSGGTRTRRPRRRGGRRPESAGYPAVQDVRIVRVHPASSSSRYLMASVRSRAFPPLTASNSASSSPSSRFRATASGTLGYSG